MQAPRIPTTGDRVLFHYVEAHVCGGKECHCDYEAPKQTRPAVIKDVVLDDAVFEVVMDVEFTAEDLATHGWLPEQRCRSYGLGSSSHSGWTFAE